MPEPKNNNMDVSIIIVNYNTSALIKDLLDSVYRKTEGVSFEIIIVDNNPTNKFSIDLKEYLDKIIYLPLEENVGFGRANNEGLKVAKGRNIFFLNPDTLLINNAIKILSDYLDKNEEVGVCGGNLYNAENEPTHSYQMIFASLLWELNLLFGRSMVYKLFYGKSFTFNYSENVKEVAYITGADMMVRRSILDNIGYFNQQFFMYYEETELSFRVHKAGYKICSVPQAKLFHLEGKSVGNNISKQTMMLASRKIFYKLTKGRKKIDDFLCCTTFYLRYLFCLLSRDKEGSTYWKALIDLV